MRLIRRALDVWRSEGLVALAGRVRHRLNRSRYDGDLVAGLDAPLPETFAVGEGNVLFVSGWCFHPASPVRGLQVVVNGLAYPATAIELPRTGAHRHASAFAAMVPFPRDETDVRAEVDLQARLDDGSRSSRRLGTIRLQREGSPPDRGPRAAATGPAPRVAICMASYNPPMPLFAAQIQSIRDQTLEDWVCLISDDGSDPELLDGIRRVAGQDSRFRLVEWPQRAGFYHNFERCLSLVPAGTELVALSDHDDRWHPDKLQSLASAFQPGTTLVYSDMNIIDERGAVLSNTYWTTRPNRYDDLASLLIANTVTGAASMFRAELLRQLLPFPQRLAEPFHDHWLACVALAAGRIRYVDRPLYDYVQHSANVLGHYAPPATTAWADARAQLTALSKEGPRRFGAVLARWRGVYFGELQKVKLMARVLELRCGAVLTAGKARSVRRLARLGESPATAAWLALRSLRGRATETLGGERTLLRGVLWRLYARVRAAFAPRPHASGPRGRLAGSMETVRQVEQKIAPLRLRITRAAPQRVNLLIPTIDFTYFFGGYIAKFNLARRLAEQGRKVRVVAVDYCPDRMSTWREQVKAFEGLAGVFDRVEVALAADRDRPLEVSPDDSFIATTWWTAHIAHRAVQALDRRRFVYLIQEYEPFTFPMGTFSALAAQSYAFPHAAVFSTELLRDYFRQSRIGVFAQGGEAGERDSVSFQNAITPVGAVTADQIANRRPRRLLFYARPEAHAARNMFELGVLGLSRAIAEGCFEADWEFHGLGAVSTAGRLPLGGGATLLVHPRQTQEAYRDFLRAHDLGLSLMYTPHSSLVPIEMASAGMLVVTNSFANKTAERLAAISSNMVVIEPTVDGVARGLQQAAAGIHDYERRACGSRVEWSTHWDASFDAEVMGRVTDFLARG